MVAQTKADVRSAADKPVASGKKGVQQAGFVDGKETLDDQAAAAAVVDADQAEAVAAQVVADGGIMPTEAPTQSIGEIAQATSPTTTDTTTTDTTSTTTAPPVEGASAGLSPWAIGGIALLGVGAIAAVASSGGDNDTPVAAAPPPSVPPPGPAPGPAPANVAPTSANSTVPAEADGTTALSASNFPFTDANAGDALTTVRIGAITSTPVETVTNPALAVDTTSGHGYELVAGVATWEQANAAAIARGGYLAVLDTATEMAFVNANFSGLGPDTGDGGAWVGLRQAADAATPGAGWTWVDGTALPGDSPLWSDAFGGSLPGDFRDEPFTAGLENHEADFGGIYEGTSDTDTALLFDRGAGTGHPNAGTDTLPQYLIEYNTTSALTLNGAAVAAGQTIAVADLAALTWNTVFNTGGTVAFAVGDKAGAYSTPENTLTITPPAAATSVATMIDDQHINVLA
ncbi:MAG: C-type lectin domain-containing protein [Lautropia sp.]|nr:C-type lectin domain-containing protein [Lautropia sp.]